MQSDQDSECQKPIYGPLGSCVGHCELEESHSGPCRINGVCEEDMLKFLPTGEYSE